MLYYRKEVAKYFLIGLETREIKNKDICLKNKLNSERKLNCELNKITNEA